MLDYRFFKTDFILFKYKIIIKIATQIKCKLLNIIYLMKSVSFQKDLIDIQD